MTKQGYKEASNNWLCTSAVLKVIMKFNKMYCDRAEVFACCIVVVE